MPQTESWSSSFTQRTPALKHFPARPPYPLLSTSSYSPVVEFLLTLVFLSTQCFNSRSWEMKCLASLSVPPFVSQTAFLAPMTTTRTSPLPSHQTQDPGMFFPAHQTHPLLLWNEDWTHHGPAISFPLSWHFSWLFQPILTSLVSEWFGGIFDNNSKHLHATIFEIIILRRYYSYPFYQQGGPEKSGHLSKP